MGSGCQGEPRRARPGKSAARPGGIKTDGKYAGRRDWGSRAPGCATNVETHNHSTISDLVSEAPLELLRVGTTRLSCLYCTYLLPACALDRARSTECSRYAFPRSQVSDSRRTVYTWLHGRGLRLLACLEGLSTHCATRHDRSQMDSAPVSAQRAILKSS